MTRRATEVVVRDLLETDWPDMERIYAQGIATGHATFETSPPAWHRFNASRLPDHRLVAVEPGGVVLGWAAVTPVSTREVYAGVVEHSLYVDAGARGRGIGGRLLQELIRSTEQSGLWTIQSSIFPENTASLALHGRQGFRVVGTRERIARMACGPRAGQWRDIVFLERRSRLAGT